MKKYKAIPILLMAAMLLVFGTGCTAGGGATPSAQATDKNTVVIQNYRYTPSEITIQKGETVTWINMDSIVHTATGSGFDSGNLSYGKSYKHTFNEAGMFDYYCIPHPYMTGKVIVK